MKARFDEIRITDLDVDLTQPSDEAPGLWRLYLKLSEEPSPEWIEIFEQERRFPAHQVWRKAWVLGPHIVVECIPQELEQFQLNHLKEDVATVNRKFAEWTASNDADTMRHLRERAEVRKQLEELRAKLEFGCEENTQMKRRLWGSSLWAEISRSSSGPFRFGVSYLASFPSLVPPFFGAPRRTFGANYDN